MAIRHQAGGDTSTGGNWLTEPGTYHFLVTGAKESPTKRDGSPIDAAFEIELGVLNGTTTGQKDKSFSIIFWHGKPGEEKSQAFATKRIDRFLMATCLLTKQEIEQKVAKDIELADCIGRQIVCVLEKNTGKDGKERVELSFAEIYHVDDPAMKDVPKDVESLKLIGSQYRWPGGKPGDNGAAAASTAQSQPATKSFVDDL